MRAFSTEATTVIASTTVITSSEVERYASRSSRPVTRKYSARRPRSTNAFAAN
jgi:hypothetical protein